GQGRVRAGEPEGLWQSARAIQRGANHRRKRLRSRLFHAARVAGAQARRVLIDSVAEAWKVPASELSTDKGFVVHAKSGRRISYGEITKFATVPTEPPNITAADLKKPAQFKLIGRKDIGRLDVPSKVNGTAKYGIDVQIPDMVYASVLEAPVDGAKVEVLTWA